MLKGNRIVLRSVEKRDLNIYYEIWSDEEVQKYDSGFAIVPSKEYMLENFTKVMNSPRKHLSIINEKGVLIGYISYEIIKDCKNVFDIGISIGKDFRDRGYGKDSIKTLTKFLFLSCAAERVELKVVFDNLRGIKCYEGCGFIEEGKLRNRFFSEGVYKDLIIMGITKNDFHKFYNL